MTIAYISDLHFDHFCTTYDVSPKLTRQTAAYIKDRLKPQPADVLVIAGDIGHYNLQAFELLTQLRAIYDHLVVVTGNHDGYLISNSQRHKYDHNSFNRLAELATWCDSQDGIHLLDGDTITIDGITFGGCPMWYDLPTPSDTTRWREYMNDSRLILEGYQTPLPYSRVRAATFDTQAYYHKQVSHLSSLSDIDIFVSHVLPITMPDEYRPSQYRFSPYNAFYESDNLDLLKDTGASIAIFGHTHGSYDFMVSDIMFLSSTVGYPSESNYTIQTFQYNKDTYEHDTDMASIEAIPDSIQDDTSSVTSD